MKISINSLRREKRVYYYTHRHGVLKRKKSSLVRATSSLMVAVFMLGGMGALSLQILDQTKQAPAPVQRQSVAVDTTKKPGEEDKLKDAEKKAQEDEQLAKKVKSKLKNIPGGQKWSVYVRDVKSERMANINSDNVYEAANLSNLIVTLPLEAKRPSANWKIGAGKTTIEKCVQNMIAAEDVDCEKAIERYADLNTADALLDSKGMKKTVMTAKEKSTTAREMGELLYRLQNGKDLSDKARRIAFDGLYGHKQREGIPAGCDQQCLIAHITGESASVRHDAGIVTIGEAQYVVVIMTSGASWSQIADVSEMIRGELQP